MVRLSRLALLPLATIVLVPLAGDTRHSTLRAMPTESRRIGVNGGSATALTATIVDAFWQLTEDQDGDGYQRTAYLRWDPAVIGGTGDLWIFEKVYRRASGTSTWTLYVQYPARTISNLDANDQANVGHSNTLNHAQYDWLIEIYSCASQFTCNLAATPDVALGPEDDTDLSAVRLENFAEDAPVVSTPILRWFSLDPHDGDHDGYGGTVHLSWNPDVEFVNTTTLTVFEKIYWKLSTDTTWTLRETTSPHLILGSSDADIQDRYYGSTEVFSRGRYDWKVELYKSGSAVPSAMWWASARMEAFLEDNTSFGAAINATPFNGPVPLQTTLELVVYGPVFEGDLIDIWFWWDCAATSTDPAAASAACGTLPVPQPGGCFENVNGYRCLAISQTTITRPHEYRFTGEPSPKAIAIVGGSRTTEGRTTVSVSTFEMLQNGSFTSGLASWSTFGAPSPADISASVVGGVLQFSRAIPPPGTSNQAVVLQSTDVTLPGVAGITSQFDLGNTSSVRKRISVVIHEGDFSDISVCTFWLAPFAPLKTYGMRTHTTRTWLHPTFSFYAASDATSGGVFQLDNVSARATNSVNLDETVCIDPTAPLVQPLALPIPVTVNNSSFQTGTTSSWSTFGQIVGQVTNNTFEFFRPSSAPDPAGVIFQPTNTALPTGTNLVASFSLGNSSTVRKRVTILLHDLDFSDLSACTFWMDPGQPLTDYTMSAFTSEAWANATVSFYAASIGNEQWMQLDNVSVTRQPGVTLDGTGCKKLGVSPLPGSPAMAAVVTAPAPREADWIVTTTATGTSVPLFHAMVDLRQPIIGVLQLEWRLLGGDASAELQISVDGETWTPLVLLPGTLDWLTVDLDLSAYAGKAVQLRLVFHSHREAGVEGRTLQLRDLSGMLRIRRPTTLVRRAP